MEHITVKGPESRSKYETDASSFTVPVLYWEIPWVDPNDVRLVLNGMIAALRRKYKVMRHKPEQGTFGFTQTGGICMDFLYISEEQGDKEKEGHKARHQEDIIKELIFSMLSHTSLWLKGYIGLSHEWIRRGVLYPKTIYNA